MMSYGREDRQPLLRIHNTCQLLSIMNKQLKINGISNHYIELVSKLLGHIMFSYLVKPNS